MVKPTFEKVGERNRKLRSEGSRNNVSSEIGLRDELITSLANSYENQRARQVYEWELLRRKGFQSRARL